jgi:hypothetical protein
VHVFIWFALFECSLRTYKETKPSLFPEIGSLSRSFRECTYINPSLLRGFLSFESPLGRIKRLNLGNRLFKERRAPARPIENDERLN